MFSLSAKQQTHNNINSFQSLKNANNVSRIVVQENQTIENSETAIVTHNYTSNFSEDTEAAGRRCWRIVAGALRFQPTERQQRGSRLSRNWQWRRRRQSVRRRVCEEPGRAGCCARGCVQSERVGAAEDPCHVSARHRPRGGAAQRVRASRRGFVGAWDGVVSCVGPCTDR